MRAGKVWMAFDDGSTGWVPVDKVKAAQADGGKIAPRVKMRIDMPEGTVVREFNGARVPFNWQDKGEVMAADDSTKSTPMGQVFLNNARDAAASLPRMIGQAAPMVIPGAGVPAIVARLAAGVGTNALGDMAGNAISGNPVDPGASLGYGVLSSAANLPFEIAASAIPPKAPGMMASAMKPTKTQQAKAQSVESRQSGIKQAPDYERLGRQALDEGVRPTKSGKDARALRSKNEADNRNVEDILDEASQNGWQITAPQLVRSPEVRAVMRELRGQTDGQDAVKEGQSFLRAFMRARASKAVPSRPTGILNAQGNMGMTPRVPAVSENMSATRTNTEKRIWRKESAPVLKAREGGQTPVGPQQTIHARLSDALARAAKARLDNIPITRTDPEDPTRSMVVPQFNERIERRIPLAGALEDFQTRARPTLGEGLIRLVRGHAPSQEMEGLLAQKANNPEFEQLRHLMRIIGMNVAGSGGGGNW